MVTLFTERDVQIDDLLDKIADNLALGETRWQRMETTYKDLYNWLKKDDGYFQQTPFEVYPQGSVCIGTAIKPLKGEEFDLDLVLHLLDFEITSPLTIFNRLKVWLKQNPKYEGKLEPKNRCVRINFKDDYHMDVLPGRQKYTWDKNVIIIPDRALDLWVLSNPRGYAEWFLSRANIVEESLLERAYSKSKQENITRKVFMNKPLQCAVQLVKRFRDLYFENRDYATSSIILTTIFGMYYNGEDRIFDAINNILCRIHAHIISSPSSRMKVLNPVNQEEDFTEKWDKEPQYYEAFKTFTLNMYEQWQILKLQPGTIKESQILSSLSGSVPFEAAIRRQAEQVSDLRQNELLGVNGHNGNISSINPLTSFPIKKNTFFGA